MANRIFIVSPDSTTKEIKFNRFSFPAGEIHINLINAEDICTQVGIIIVSKIKSSDDLMELMLIVDAINNSEIINNNLKCLTLFIPYLPYARQDRVCSKGDPLSARVILNILSLLITHYRVDIIWTYDVHNSKIFSLLDYNTSKFIDHLVCTEFIDEILEKNNIDFIICPDNGAIPRFSEFINLLDMKDIQLVFCEKHRDPSTGKLTGFSKTDPLNFSYENKTGLIIDDICDGGGTFLGIAELFPNSTNLILAVSHGIFSKGLKILSRFSKIYTTDSYIDLDHNLEVPVNMEFNIYKLLKNT